MNELNPVFKFFGLLIPTFFLATWQDWRLNCGIFILCMVGLLCSKAKRKTLFFMLLPVLLAAVGMFSTGYHFSADGGMPVNADHMLLSSSAVLNGVTLASRVLAYAGLGLLFALTTDSITLVQAARQQLHLPNVFAYGLLAAWGVLPQMFLEFRRTRAAFRARGIRVFPASPALLRPLLIKSVRWSEELAIAMESKGFSSSAPRTEFSPVPVRPVDWIFCTLTCLVLPLACWLLLR